MKYLKYEISKDLNNLKVKDINNIARIIANANTACWDAIGFAGEVNRILNKIDDENIFKKIAKAFNNLKSKNDNELINNELYSREYQDLDHNFEKLDEFLKND